MKRTITLLLLLLLMLPAIVSAQRSSRWKRMRYEVVYGVGAANFLGELGGNYGDASDFLNDFEMRVTKPLINVGLRYRIKEKLAVKTGLSFGYLSGADSIAGKKGKPPVKGDDGFYRYNRNLHFRSPIIEFASQLEFSIIKERVGHRYNLRRVRGMRGYKVNLYGFVGLGLFYTNPQAKYISEVDGVDTGGDDIWYNLQPLGTEGQNVLDTKDRYHRLQVCIPFGLGVKYGLDRRWSIGLEYGVRYTTTDYIDDVSTVAYDPIGVAAKVDENSAAAAAEYFANPARPGYESGYAPGNQRGKAVKNDVYMFGIISLTYKLKTTRTGLPKF